MLVKIIVAYNKNRIIGVNGSIPWKIREDIQYFKDTTNGHVCIMGRKTWDSIPQKYRPLSNRVNIILTRGGNHINITDMPKTHVCNDFLTSIEMSKFLYPDKDVFVIGGAEIYKQAIDNDVVDEIIASEIKGYENIIYGEEFPINSGWKGEKLESKSEFDIWKYV